MITTLEANTITYDITLHDISISEVRDDCYQIYPDVTLDFTTNLTLLQLSNGLDNKLVDWKNIVIIHLNSFGAYDREWHYHTSVDSIDEVI